jgi:hypothetical protein
VRLALALVAFAVLSACVGVVDEPSEPSALAAGVTGAEPADAGVDACAGVVCGHGTCDAGSGAATCACEAGFHAVGLTCVADPPVDPCASVTCGAHAACAAGACACSAGFEGDPVVGCTAIPGARELEVRAQLIAAARAELGNCEGVTVRPYMLQQPGLWCYDFVAWVYAQLGSVPSPLSLPTYRIGAFPAGWRPKPGDLIKFRIQHYGVVESVSPDGQFVTTLEGNNGSCVVESAATMDSLEYIGSLDGAF